MDTYWWTTKEYKAGVHNQVVPYKTNCVSKIGGFSSYDTQVTGNWFWKDNYKLLMVW